jgi:hypothetical protein
VLLNTVIPFWALAPLYLVVARVKLTGIWTKMQMRFYGEGKVDATDLLAFGSNSACSPSPEVTGSV